MIVPPEATINVQNALRDLDARLAKIEGKSSADLSETLDLLRRDVNTALRGKAPNERDNFTGSGAGHGFGLVPSPGPYPGSNRFLAEDGTWEPVLQGVLEAITPGQAGTSVDQATLSLKGSLAVTGGLQADSIMARTMWLPTVPSCRAYHNTTQTAVTLLLNSERWDTDRMHSLTTNTSRITFNTAGLYAVGCNAGVGAGGAAGDWMSVRLNNTSYLGVAYPGPTSGAWQVSIATVWNFIVGDYIEIQKNNATSTALAGDATSPDHSDLWAHYLGPTVG